MASWVKARTSSGMPYYVTHSTRKMQWNHPKYAEIQEHIKECNVIKFATYRMAAKLLVLSKCLHMEYVRLGVVAGVFERHRLHCTENTVVLEGDELESLLSDIFFAAQKETLSQFDVDLTVELAMNLLLNCFDRRRLGSLQVLQAKVLLALLSGARLQDKYQYWFQQLADHNSCVSRRKLELLVSQLAAVADHLCEGAAFGAALVAPTVDSCFHQLQGNVGVTEEVFIGWFYKEPQLLSWLSTFHRLKAAETVSHTVKCHVCKMYPVRGLRYQCLQCLGYNQCQTCFFLGRTSKRHKLKHPVQEHCTQTSSSDSTRAFFRLLVNKMRKNSSQLRSLPLQPHDGTGDSGEDDSNLLLGDTDGELSVQTVVRGSRLVGHAQPQLELQSIIFHLEEQNRLLQKDLEKLCALPGQSAEVEDCFQEHRARVEVQITRLKQLKFSLVSTPRHRMDRIESTPIIAPGGPLGEARTLDNLSPILRSGDDSAGFSSQLQRLRLSPAGPELSSSITEVSERDLSSWTSAQVTAVREADAVGAWFRDAQASSDRKLDDLRDDLDSILDKLEKMLEANFTLDDPGGSVDNSELQQAAVEMEGLVSGLIAGVERQNKLFQPPPLSDKME
ncbi:dystrophin-like isoform X2 [Bacillus rossius redtenbacheri]|uniref:dystrophin-like isoform X2 n=1 Tax=Bacillus rossius redtenbacheri TaxID=93214 RepID=UPI002FDD3266